MKNVSPLRFPGGKTRACKILDDLAAEYFDLATMDTLVSPFFGGGSFEFHFQNKHGYALVVNDKFQPLMSFWNQVQTNSPELCQSLRNIEITKELFLQYRQELRNHLHVSQQLSPLLQGVYYFVMNRCSFNGSALSGGFSQEASIKRFTPSSIERIAALDLSRVSLHNEDFETFIHNIHKQPCSNVLMFLDPPYYLEGKSNLYGDKGDMHEQFQHERLAEILQDKYQWIMTYNNCDYITPFYN